MVACDIWSATMTGEGDYVPFVISRLIGGLFGSVPLVLGNGIIMNIFHFEDRGKAFAIFVTAFILGKYSRLSELSYAKLSGTGGVGGPTFDGFIIEHTNWPVEFWWIVGLQGVTALLAFLFLEETGYHRNGGKLWPQKPRSWIQDRLATFFPGSKVMPSISLYELVCS